MTALRSALDARRDEFEAHFHLARALEDRLLFDDQAILGSVSLSVRHINTMKSGLIVHLYNIVEALMDQVMGNLGIAIGSVEPRRWAEGSLREWLRASIASRISDSNEDARVSTIYQASASLMASDAMGPQKLEKPSGTWDDKLIAMFARRMEVAFNLPPELLNRIGKSPKYGDQTPLQFLADRRNAIAHGRRSFENGASDLLLSDIGDLADVTLDYLMAALDAFHEHVECEAYLVSEP